MIKVVLIDIDDTILDFDKCSAYAMKMAGIEFGVPFTERLYQTFLKINPTLWQNIEKGLLTRDELHRTRWQRIFDELGIIADGPEFEKRFRYYIAESYEKTEGAEDILKYLSSKYEVYAASNAPYAQQLKRMELAGFSKYLSGYFVSEEIGHEKPTKEFFDACFKTLGNPDKNEVIMIGDSISADIKGAENYGIKSIWVNLKNKECNPQLADYTVTRLEEIKGIL